MSRAVKSNKRVPQILLAILIVVAFLVAAFVLGYRNREVVVETKTVEKKVEVPKVQKVVVATNPKATCMYTAILAYPEYVVPGGEYENNGGKQLLDVLPECKTLTKKDKVKMRAQINSMINAGV